MFEIFSLFSNPHSLETSSLSFVVAFSTDLPALRLLQSVFIVFIVSIVFIVFIALETSVPLDLVKFEFPYIFTRLRLPHAQIYRPF